MYLKANKMNSIMFIVLAIFHILVLVNSERTKDKMYSSISGTTCFRRLNGTHQTGCSSKFNGGSVGVLHLVKSLEDIDFILKDPPSPPYAPILYPHHFTRENILRLKSDFVSAIILINNITNLDNFSQESKCPNQFSGLLTGQTCDVNKPDTAWNPFGSGILQEDLPFPIFFVSDKKEIDKIIDCFEKFNDFDYENQKQRSLCSVEVRTFMSAAVNSEVCISRTKQSNPFTNQKICDPLNGKNVFATLFPREIVSPELRKVNEEERFILVSCRMDTTSMFDGLAPGAQGSLVTMTTVLGAAHLLSKLLPVSRTTHKNIIFMLFNGESYDYIGSQRFVYDLNKGLFPYKNLYSNPINITSIELMIDIGSLDDLGNIKLYHATDFKMVKKMTDLLIKYNDHFKFNTTTSSLESINLPPTSAHSFLRENITFPAVILTSKPSNKFYHSIYDNSVNIGYQYVNTSRDFTELDDSADELIDFKFNSIQIAIRNVSSILAFTLYSLISDLTYTQSKIASSVLIDELLHCFLERTDCPLFKAASHPDRPVGGPIPPYGYISVQDQELTGGTFLALGYLVSQSKSEHSKENCSILPLYWYAGFNGTGECRLTTQNYSLAYSPAFIEEGYDWKSGKYSTWTESTWRELSARIFLRPAPSHEALTLAIGVVVLIISFLLIFLINSKSDILFGNVLSTVPDASSVPVRC